MLANGTNLMHVFLIIYGMGNVLKADYLTALQITYIICLSFPNFRLSLPSALYQSGLILMFLCHGEQLRNL